jgi:hypothetical protein
MPSGYQLNGYDLLNDCKPIVEIGITEATICADGSKYFFGNVTAQGYLQIYWFTSMGTGSFSNQYSLHPKYHPSTNDYLQDYIDIQVHVSDYNNYGSDTMLLYFSHPPIVSAGEDATVNEGKVFYFSDPVVSDYTAVHWTSNGDGIFDNDSEILNQCRLVKEHNLRH